MTLTHLSLQTNAGANDTLHASGAEDVFANDCKVKNYDQTVFNPVTSARIKPLLLSGVPICHRRCRRDSVDAAATDTLWLYFLCALASMTSERM